MAERTGPLSYKERSSARRLGGKIVGEDCVSRSKGNIL